MSPQRAQEPLPEDHAHQRCSAQPVGSGRASGLLALSAEDKARIGNLIKVLAKERRDKEDLREKLGQQASRLQDLEKEREVSQQKEAELVARVTRSVDLLRTYQLEASSRQQGFEKGPGRQKRGHDDELAVEEEAEMVRPSPDLPPLPQLRLFHPQERENDAESRSNPPVQSFQPGKEHPEVKESRAGLLCNDLQSAEPLPSEAVESARQPADLQKQIFALKPPQLSVLQRYLSIQDNLSQCKQSPQNPGVQMTRSERAASSPSMSPKKLARTSSVANPGARPKARSPLRSPLRSQGDLSGEGLRLGDLGDQRLRLGRPRRWAQYRAAPAFAKLERSHSPADSRPSSERAEARNASRDSRFDSRLTRTLDVPSEPLLGSPLATSSARQSGSIAQKLSTVKNPGLSLESLSHWPAPLRLESCYAPNMFDVIDSLESGSCVASTREKASEPSSISEELRRLQRELVSIQHKISQGPLWGSPLDDRMRTQAAWGEESPSTCQREIFPSFSLGQWKTSETEASQELSEEIDEVVNLLQTVKSKETKEHLEFP